MLEMTTERLARALDPRHKLLRRVLRVPRTVRIARESRVGVSAHEQVAELGSARLLRYRRTSPATQREPLLICYALVNRPYILDLRPDKSVVQRYLEQGFEVYLIDWGVPALSDRKLTLEHYVTDFLLGAIDRVLTREACEKLHLLGYCMGGTMSTIATALYPERIRTLTLLASPIDFSGRESLLNVWSDARYFELDALVDTFGNCPALLLQTVFLMTKPVQNVLEKALTFYERMEDAEFLTHFFAVDRWVNDNIPVAGETFRQFVRKLYQHNELVRGELRLGDELVDLTRIECPLLLLTAHNDHLVPSKSTVELREHVSSLDVEVMSIDAGHVGLVVSAKAHEKLWPEVTRWLAQRSTPRIELELVAAAHRPSERSGQPMEREEMHG
jgi:polyhydroxyalkanoate synthase subunit PhaC